MMKPCKNCPNHKTQDNKLNVRSYICVLDGHQLLRLNYDSNRPELCKLETEIIDPTLRLSLSETIPLNSKNNLS